MFKLKKVVKASDMEKIKGITLLLALYLFLAPLDFIPILPGVSVSKILILLPLVGSIFYLKYLRIKIDKYSTVAILYIVVLTFTMFYSYDASLTIQRIISIGLNITVILILSMLKYNESEVKILKKAVVLSGWFTLLLMFLYSNNSMLSGRLTVVVNGIYQDPNYLTGFLIFSIIYYLDDFMQRRKKLSLIKMCFFIVFVLLTGSRGGLIAVIGSILFYCAISFKNKKNTLNSLFKLMSLVLTFCIIAILAIQLLPDDISQRYSLSFTMNDSGAGRWEIWESILLNYQQSPLFNQIFGMGAGTINYFTYNGNVAHNIWVESLMEIGIFGLMILFLFYVLYLIKACKMLEFVTASAIVGYLIMAMSMSLYSYKPIWNIILLILIIKNFKVGHSQKKKKEINIRVS